MEGWSRSIQGQLPGVGPACGILCGAHMAVSLASHAVWQVSPHPSLLSSVSDYVIDDKVAVLQKRDHEGFGFVLRGAKGNEGFGGSVWGYDVKLTGKLLKTARVSLSCLCSAPLLSSLPHPCPLLLPSPLPCRCPWHRPYPVSPLPLLRPCLSASHFCRHFSFLPHHSLPLCCILALECLHTRQ